MLSRMCNIDEQGSQLSGMGVSPYIFENGRERDARLHRCSLSRTQGIMCLSTARGLRNEFHRD